MRLASDRGPHLFYGVAMTDNPEMPRDTGYQTALKVWEARARLGKKSIELNKASIIEALKSAGITRVTIEFDGSGDDGGICSTICDGAVKDVPQVPVNEWQPGEKNTLAGLETSLPTAIENFAYALLEHTEAGWENNEGAYGDIVIDVDANTVTHTHNARYSDVNISGYEY
jgi:hypothetical protein